MDIKKFVDLHVHIGPEVLPRRFTVKTLVEEERGKIKGLGLKSHFYPTMPLIKSFPEGENQEETQKQNPLLIGSLTLNNYIGGLNPDAIYASAKLSSRPIIVWFPTINAEQFLSSSRYEIPPEWVGEGFTSRLSSTIKPVRVTTQENKLTPQALNAVKSIKNNNCILATGHISWKEAVVLVNKSLEVGVKKIIVTHPIYQKIDMPIIIQKKLAENKEVFIEQSYSMYAIDKIPMDLIVKQIKAVNPKNCIITSDTGQQGNPSPSEALKRFVSLLQSQGVDQESIEEMGITNPSSLIN